MSLEKTINDAWEKKDQVNQDSDQSLKDAINQVIKDLDSGKSRVQGRGLMTVGYFLNPKMMNFIK